MCRFEYYSGILTLKIIELLKIARYRINKHMDRDIINPIDDNELFPIIDKTLTYLMFSMALLISFVIIGVTIGSVSISLNTALFVWIWLNILSNKKQEHMSTMSKCFIVTSFIVFITSLISYNLNIRFGGFYLSESFMAMISSFITIKITLTNKCRNLMNFVDKNILT